MAQKTKPPKAAKAKAPKSAASKSTAIANEPKAGAATKASKGLKAGKASKGNLKAVKAAARSKSKPDALETQVETYHVLLAPLPALIHTAEPHPGELSIGFSSFADAKERAIDHLIELIEEAERRLHRLRHAASPEEIGQ